METTEDHHLKLSELGLGTFLRGPIFKGEQKQHKPPLGLEGKNNVIITVDNVIRTYFWRNGKNYSKSYQKEIVLVIVTITHVTTVF